MIGRPGPGEFGAYYAPYLERVDGGDLLGALRPHAPDLLRSADPALGGHRYAPGKWTLAQSAQHVVDTERVFAYRALRIARGDQTSLPGFDQDAYAEATGDRPLAALADELDRVRAATLDLFASLSPEAAVRMGTASGHPLSVRAAGWIIAGHERHHVALWRERYLTG